MGHYTETFMDQTARENRDLKAKLDRVTEISKLSNIAVDVRFNMIREIVNPQ
jgi:hypothetical protein